MIRKDFKAAMYQGKFENVWHVKEKPQLINNKIIGSGL